MQPILTTRRLLLRPLTPDDVGALDTIWGDPEVVWWGASADLDGTAELVARILDRTQAMRDGLGWWLAVHDGTVVGDVVLQVPRWDPDVVEVGWHLARDHQGRGYATEGARALLRHGFDGLGLAAVDAIVAEENLPSQAVAARLGMRVVGTLDHLDLPHLRYRVTPVELTPGPDATPDGSETAHSSREDEPGTGP